MYGSGEKISTLASRTIADFFDKQSYFDIANSHKKTRVCLYANVRCALKHVFPHKEKCARNMYS